MAAISIVSGLAALEVITLGAAIPLVAVRTVLVVGGTMAVLSSLLILSIKKEAVLGLWLSGKLQASNGLWQPGLTPRTCAIWKCALEVCSGVSPKKRYFSVPNSVKVIKRFPCIIEDHPGDCKNGDYNVGVVYAQIFDCLGGQQVPIAALFGGDMLALDGIQSKRVSFPGEAISRHPKRWRKVTRKASLSVPVGSPELEELACVWYPEGSSAQNQTVGIPTFRVTAGLNEPVPDSDKAAVAYLSALYRRLAVIMLLPADRALNPAFFTWLERNA